MRYALRSLAGARAFSAGALVCLSVGLTLTIAAFSLINAVFFRSMPGLRNQHELRHIWLFANAEHGRQIVPPQQQVAVRATGPSVATRAVLAAANYFEVLGTTPVMGRLLDGSDPHAA